tara:strand:- start:134 stop:418 length:285 start_codon:yes stop_codon:yes gene_type:complete
MYNNKFYEVNSSHSRTKYFSTLEKAHTYCKNSLKNFPTKVGQFWWKDFDFNSRFFSSFYKPLGCYTADISDVKDFDTYGFVAEYHITERLMDSV